MLWAYVDDSNIHDRKTGSPAIIGHGGAVSTYERWKALEADWDRILSPLNIPVFHMTDFEAYKGPFRDWTKEQHENVLNDLLVSMKRHIVAYVGYSVPKSEKKFIDSHKSSIGRMLSYCAQEATKSDDGKVGLVFANQPEISSTRLGQFVTAISRAMPALHSFTGANPADCRALQAADLLAYEFVRWRDAPNPMKARYPIRYLYADARQTFHVFHA